MTVHFEFDQAAGRVRIFLLHGGRGERLMEIHGPAQLHPQRPARGAIEELLRDGDVIDGGLGGPEPPGVGGAACGEVEHLLGVGVDAQRGGSVARFRAVDGSGLVLVARGGV